MIRPAPGKIRPPRQQRAIFERNNISFALAGMGFARRRKNRFKNFR